MPCDPLQPREVCCAPVDPRNGHSSCNNTLEGWGLGVHRSCRVCVPAPGHWRLWLGTPSPYCLRYRSRAAHGRAGMSRRGWFANARLRRQERLRATNPVSDQRVPCAPRRPVIPQYCTKGRRQSRTRTNQGMAARARTVLARGQTNKAGGALPSAVRATQRKDATRTRRLLPSDDPCRGNRNDLAGPGWPRTRHTSTSTEPANPISSTSRVGCAEERPRQRTHVTGGKHLGGLVLDAP
jgi:hypothetical protein